MQVKLINQALKRVQLPDLSPGKLEAFKAGVRALAYELEKDTTTLQSDLSDLICKVFDNEDSFIKAFSLACFQVEEFYMAGARCMVSITTTNGLERTTIKTADFLAWVEGLDNGKQ
jgi:hypothetical protein